MQVNRDLFQSPSTSQVQIGKPDPSAVKEDAGGKTNLEFEIITGMASKNLDVKQAQDVLVSNKQHSLDVFV